MTLKYSLEEIFDKEEQILIDGSINRARDCLKQIENRGIIKNSNEPEITQALCETGKLNKLLDKRNIYTLPGVCKEYNKYLILIENLTAKSFGRGLNRSISEKMLDLQEETSKTYRLLEQKNIFKFKEIAQINYLFFTKMFQVLDQAISLKRDTAYMYGNHSYDKSKESIVDESLCSAAVCLSLAKQPISIVTNDTDFVRLIWICPSMLGSDMFLPFNIEFRESLKKYPIKLYCMNKKSKLYNCAGNTKEVYFSEDFRVHNLQLSESEKVKNRIMDLWETHFYKTKDTYQKQAIPVNL